MNPGIVFFHIISSVVVLFENSEPFASLYVDWLSYQIYPTAQNDTVTCVSHICTTAEYLSSYG